MKERYVDIALIAALVLIAGTIVYTLFGTSRPRVEAANTPQVGVETTEQPAGVEPVTPDNTNEATTEDVVPVVPSGDEVLTTEAENETEATPVTPETTPETQEASAPLPEGAVDLERVGFSFVTGGAGACNIVLEPWQHIAVSSDLRDLYPCGTEVTITLDEEVAGRTSFRAVVADGIRNAERTVNIYVGQDEPALEYGLKDGTLEP
jgi:hypothetical protein